MSLSQRSRDSEAASRYPGARTVIPGLAEGGEVGVVQPPAQQGGQFPRARKGEEPDSPCNAREKQFCWHLDFSAMRSTVDSDRHSCVIINLCYISCWVGANLWEQLLLEQTTPFCFLTRTSAIGQARGRRSKGGKERFLPPGGSAKERGAQVNHSIIPVMGGTGQRQKWLRQTREQPAASAAFNTHFTLCAPTSTISKVNYI